MTARIKFPLLLALLFACTAHAQFVPIGSPGVVGGGTGVWSLAQNPTQYPETTATFTITLPAPSAIGNVGALIGVTNSGTNTLSSITGGGTWNIQPGCHANGGGSIGGTDCAYVIYTSSVSSLSVTLNATSNSRWYYYEGNFTGMSGISLDAVGTFPDTTSGTSLTGVGLGLSGSNDFIIQLVATSGGNVTAISSPYTDFQGASFTGTAVSLNTTSGSAPTFTNSNAQTSLAAAIAFSGTGVAPPSFALVQHPNNFTCAFTTAAATHSCTLTGITSTVAGQGIAVASAIFDQAPSGNAPTIASVTGDTSLVHCTTPNPVYQTVYIAGTNGNAALDCYETTSAVGSTTAITVTWNTPGQTGTPFTYIDVELVAFSKSLGSISVDTTGTSDNSGANCTTCTGPPLTLTGSNDFIFQFVAMDNPNITGPGAPWTNPIDYDQNNVTAAFAGALNQTSYAPPTWTTSGTTGYFISGAIAFK